jgi:hypothetical protein
MPGFGGHHIHYPFFKLALCGYTLRVTSQTSYSPEYITPTQKNQSYRVCLAFRPPPPPPPPPPPATPPYRTKPIFRHLCILPFPLCIHVLVRIPYSKMSMDYITRCQLKVISVLLFSSLLNSIMTMVCVQ